VNELDGCGTEELSGKTMTVAFCIALRSRNAFHSLTGAEVISASGTRSST